MTIEYKKFEVTGRGTFPIDMLRHDECYPATERDAMEVSRIGFRTVALWTANRFSPTTARWESFGWHVRQPQALPEPKEKPVKSQVTDLIEYAMKQGHGIEIVDPDNDDEYKKTYYGEDKIYWVTCEVKSWDGGQDFVIVHDNKLLFSEKKRIWVGLAIGYGNHEWEEVYDYSVHPFMEEWSKQYSEKYRDE